MDPRRDYPNFTDAALDFFIRRFPSHPDHAAALAEIERRRTSRKPTVERAGKKTPRVDKAVLIWAVGGIVVLALVLLFLLLPIAMAKTSHKPRPTSHSGPSVPVDQPSVSAKGLSDTRPSPEASRQLHRGQH